MRQKIWVGPSPPSFGQNPKEQLLLSGDRPWVSGWSKGHLKWKHGLKGFKGLTIILLNIFGKFCWLSFFVICISVPTNYFFTKFISGHLILQNVVIDNFFAKFHFRKTLCKCCKCPSVFVQTHAVSQTYYSRILNYMYIIKGKEHCNVRLYNLITFNKRKTFGKFLIVEVSGMGPLFWTKSQKHFVPRLLYVLCLAEDAYAGIFCKNAK